MSGEEEKKGGYKVDVSPHAKDPVTTKSVMWTVVLALTPAFLGSIYYFGLYSLLVTITCVLSAVFTERIIVSRYNTSGDYRDGAAVLTGLLLAFCLPPTVPLWIPVLGAVFAIGVVKHAFGGLGFNIFNPALMGRAFLLTSWPVIMTSWSKPIDPFRMTASHDAVTTATPLAVAKMQGMGELASQYASQSEMYRSLLLGNIGGCIGETSALLLALGGIFLVLRKIITWHIPVVYLGTVAVLSALMGQDILFQLLAGGLFLGAFYMATDYVTSPLTSRGKIIFAVGCGVITMVIRVYGGLPEGVSYSILVMNGFTPLIDRFTKTLPKGWAR